MRSLSIFVIVGSLIFLAACGGGGTPSGVPITVTVSANPTSLNPGQTSTITAAVANTSNTAVTWSISPSGFGTLSSTTANPVTYTAPTSVTTATGVTITATSAASSSASGSVQLSVASSAGSVALSPAAPQTLNQGGTLSITATPSNTGSTSVSWNTPSVGSLSSTSGSPVTYTAPGSVTGNTLVTLTATSGSATATLEITVMTSGAGSNVAAVNVNGGPVSGQVYANGVLTSVLVCVPNTSNCQTVDDVLVDTGSVGLRVLASAIPNIAGALPVETYTDGSQINECVAFIDGSYLWGKVAQADILIGGEKASGAPTQVVADPTGFSIPTSCSNGGTDEDTQALLGTNGIIGVGPEPLDCGPGCDPGAGGTPPPGFYYASCTSSSGCQSVFVSCGALCSDSAANQQVENPVYAFVADNNGVVIAMPSVASAQATASGSLIFGIGTETNNGLGSATILTLDSSDEFTASFQGSNLVESFLDSGSNGLFFPNLPSLPLCTNDSSFYCPTSLLTYPVTNFGQSGTSVTSVSVDNAIGQSANAGDAVFGNAAGPEQQTTPPTPCNGNINSPSGDCTFDFGFSFFYGRTIFTAIDQTTASGTPGPFFAY